MSEQYKRRISDRPIDAGVRLMVIGVVVAWVIVVVLIQVLTK
jgi:hypothetical protein